MCLQVLSGWYFVKAQIVVPITNRAVKIPVDRSPPSIKFPFPARRRSTLWLLKALVNCCNSGWSHYFMVWTALIYLHVVFYSNRRSENDFCFKLFSHFLGTTRIANAGNDCPNNQGMLISQFPYIHS